MSRASPSAGHAADRLRRVEARNRALLDALPDPMFRIARDGTLLDVHADDGSALLLSPERLIGSNVRDVLPPPVAEAVVACVERALSTGARSSVEYELEIDGVERSFESRMVPSGDGEVVSIVRDFTDQRQTETAQRRLAEEQAAVRRVATMVASDAPPERVFQIVTEAACGLLGIRTAVLHRFEDAHTSTIVGKFGEPTGDFEPGRVNALEGTALAVLETGAPARTDYAQLSGPGVTQLRELGYRGGVGVPIAVAGSTWGALVVGLKAHETLPPETERRLQDFAELVGLAVASAQARNELTASRLRLVEASDAERRRIERNLHDGAQQRLLALAVGLRLARARLPQDPDETARLLASASDELNETLTELRELAQGIHPAVLTERGLETALDVLAARAPISVALDVRLAARLPEPVEAAAYYVVSEAIANVVKHARAESALVRVDRSGSCAVVEISDNGVGGVDPDVGSGLRGLRDRVEALGGRLAVESRPGRGTVVRAEFPVSP